MKEGRNAGMWTVGVLKGGSELGLAQEEVAHMAADELEERMAKTSERLRAAGAHYVIDEIGLLDEVLEKIKLRQAAGERP